MRPKGRVYVRHDGADERIEVPLQVARSLDKLIKSGDLPQDDLEAFQSTLPTLLSTCAWNRVLALVEMRDYSSSEMARKLAQDGYPPDVCSEALARAASCRLIDDARFSEFFIRSKIAAGWGRDRIRRELLAKGIDAERIEGWPDEFFSDEADYERAYAIASKKHLTGKNDFQKIMRLLSAKGYAPQLAYRVARDVLDDAGGCPS